MLKIRRIPGTCERYIQLVSILKTLYEYFYENFRLCEVKIQERKKEEGVTYDYNFEVLSGKMMLVAYYYIVLKKNC